MKHKSVSLFKLKSWIIRFFMVKCQNLEKGLSSHRSFANSLGKFDLRN